MYSSIDLITVLTVCCILYYYATVISERRRAKALGAELAHLQKNLLPLGIDHVQRMAAANKAGRAPDEYAKVADGERRTTYRMKVFGSSFIHTIEPANIQAILATQFTDFSLGDFRRGTVFPFLGNGIFSTDGKQWEHSRAMIRPQFARAQVADLELEERHVQELLRLIHTDQSGWTQAININQMFFRLTFDSATEFFFGMSVHSQRQSSGSYEWKNLAKSFDTGTKHLGDRMRLLDFYWLHNPKELRDSIKEVHRFADYCVRAALERSVQEKRREDTDPHPGLEDTKKQKYTFLDELIKVTQDPIELRSQLLNILLAGRDTTASLLGWTLWLLARHPDVFHKLRSQILNDFGPYDQIERITFSSLKSCTYLQHVMKESLRLYPPVPINARIATKDTTLPLGGGVDGKSPVFVKKGQGVGYYVYAMHRKREFWGDDAEQFKPDRWIGRKQGWEYLPFNGGPRVCLGQQFALTEAGYVITRMLQRFDAMRLEDEAVPGHRLGLTGAPYDYMIYFHEAR